MVVRPTITLSCLLVLASATTSSASAAEWTKFRGPRGDGHVATALPTEWTDSANVVWSTDLPGLAWSSPVVHNRVIYLTTAVPAGQNAHSLRVLALSAETGQVVWNREVFRKQTRRIHSKNSHASPTPICDGERLFVHFGSGATACLDLKGEILWQQTSIEYNMVHGNGGSPVLVKDLLVFSCDGGRQQFVVALKQDSGKIAWKQARPAIAGRKKFAFSTPTVIEVDGQTQIVSCGADQVNALDPGTGAILWTIEYTGYSVIPKPVYGHGLIFVSTSYDRPELLAIRPGTKARQPEVVWRRKRGAPHTPSLLLVGQELYFVSDRGVAACVDALTGEEHWQQRLGGNYSASPLHADGKIYFQSEQGVGTVIEAGTKYTEIAKNDVQARTLASYGVIGEDILLRTEDRLLRIAAKK